MSQTLTLPEPPPGMEIAIARLRGIVGSRLMSKGFSLGTISEAFCQSENCTHEQIRKTDILIRTHPRYERFSELQEATRP